METLLAFGHGHLIAIIKAAAVLYLFGVVAYFIERLRPAEPRARFFKSDFRTELGFPIFNALVTTPFFVLLAHALTTYVLEPYAPYHVFDSSLRDQPLALQVLVVLLFGDLAVYVEHRISHGPLWPYHALHHVTREINWLTHARLHPVNVVTIACAGLLTNFIFGVGGSAIVIATWVANLIAVWEHLNLEFAWPRPFHLMFVSPHFHRWHHAAEPAAVDKNFALIFPFYDWLFGTYYCPDRLPVAYGISADDGDPRGDPAVPDDFAGQLAYPFRGIVRKLRARRPATAIATPRSES